MKKQAYFKMMKLASINKQAETEYNTLGPLLGIIAGMYGANLLAGGIHKKPGFWTKLLYMLPGAAVGAYLGNWGQNALSGTDNNPIWHKLFDTISDAAIEDKNAPQVKPDPVDEEVVEKAGFSAKNNPPEDYPLRYNPWSTIPYQQPHSDEPKEGEGPTDQDIIKTFIEPNFQDAPAE